MARVPNPLPERPPVPTVARPLHHQEFEDWIIYLKAMMRHDLAEAERYSDAWEERKELIQESILCTRGAIDKVVLRARSKEDIPLADNMDAWSFFQRRALLYAGVIQAEMAARLGGFGR